jgi:hypothetical protein
MDFFVEDSPHSKERVARIWSEQLASRISTVLSREDQSESVLRFPSRAAYLSQFVWDLVAGRAWGKWYYEEFESLNNLSMSRAIREAMLREPGHTIATILCLGSQQRLEGVLCELKENDAQNIYEACFDDPGSTESGQQRQWSGRILELWNEAPLRPFSAEENLFRDGLRLLARVATRYSEAANNSDVRVALDGLLEVRRVLDTVRSPSALDRLLRSLAESDLQTAVELTFKDGAANAREGLAFFARMIEGDLHWATQAAGTLMSGTHVEMGSAARRIYNGESFLTLFGGIFLLGPSLLELDIEEISSAAAQNGDPSGLVVQIVRHLICIKCLGRSRAEDSMGDASMRLFSGFEKPSAITVLHDLRVKEAAIARIRQTFVDNLAKKNRSQGCWLLAETVSLPDSETQALLVRDVQQDEWLFVTTVSGAPSKLEEGLGKALRLVCQATGTNSQVLLLSGSFSGSANSNSLQNNADRVISFDRQDQCGCTALAEELKMSRERFCRLTRPVDQDLAYFSLSGLWPKVALNPALDLILSVVARAALKHFAGRLMGFEASSPEYLYKNFLAGTGTVRVVLEGLQIELPRSPLSLVLRLAGMQRQSYALPWQEGREICLLPPQE